MIVFISCKENSKDAMLDERFARSDYYCLYDSDQKTYSFIKNNVADEVSGAGVKLAQKMVDDKIDFIITGRLGPKSNEILQATDIKLRILRGLTVSESIEQISE